MSWAIPALQWVSRKDELLMGCFLTPVSLYSARYWQLEIESALDNWIVSSVVPILLDVQVSKHV